MRRPSRLASATATRPATARNTARRNSEPFTAQVMAAMEAASPSQPATMRGRTSSSMPDTTRQSIALKRQRIGQPGLLAGGGR